MDADSDDEIKGLHPCPLNQSPAVQQACEDAATCVVFKVDASLDWSKLLEGARLRLSPKSTELVRAGRGGELEDGSALSVSQDAVAWPVLVPLRGVKDEGKLRPAGQGAPQVVRMIKMTTRMQKASEIVNAAREKADKIAKRLQDIEAQQKKRSAKQIDRWRKYINVSSLQDDLAECGWLAEDPATASVLADRMPATAGAISAEGNDGDESAEAGTVIFHLRPVSKAGDESDQGDMDGALLAEFRECPLSLDSWPPLHLRRHLLQGKRVLRGHFKDAKQMKLMGKMLPPAKVSTTETTFRYLVGFRTANSKRLHVVEAERYCLERIVPKAKTVDPKHTIKNYGELRQKAVEGLGTSAAARLVQAQAKRKAQELRAADFGLLAESLADTAQAQMTKQVSVDERLAAATKRVMPEFNQEGANAREIWEPAIEQLVPHGSQSEVAFNDALYNLLRRSPHEVTRSALDEVIQGRFIKEIIITRVKHRQSANKNVVATEDQAKDLVYHFAVMESFCKLLSVRHGKHKLDAVAELTGLVTTSVILKKWFDYCYDFTAGNRYVKKLNTRKLFIAILVLGLYAAPNQEMVVPQEVEAELCAGCHIMRKEFMNELDALGGYHKKAVKGSDALIIGLGTVPREKIVLPSAKKRKTAGA